MSLVTKEIRAKASEIHHGDEICKAQFQRLLKEVGLPNGLLPLEDVEECGYVEDTGFVWMKQKKEIKRTFEKIDRKVRYATEVTAFIEPCKIKKLTGVKAKELMIWLNLTEISVDSPESDKIVFKATTGLFRTFPTDAFVVKGMPQPASGVSFKAVKDMDMDKKEEKIQVEVASVVKEV